MSLLHEIQESIVQEDADLGSILLKLRLLASRLGSEVLEEWVKHESEGYPEDIAVPPYRTAKVSYTGTFSDSFGSGLNNVPISSHLVKQFANESWVNSEIRESIAAVNDLVKKTSKKGSIGIDASNLILLLQGNVYEDYACNAINGTISRTAFVEIVQTVRSRILELTLKIEKTTPEASLVTFGAPEATNANPEKIQQISQQIIYGNVSTAVTGGHGANIAIAISERDKDSFISHLVKSGIPEVDAIEFAEIVETEEPQSEEEPFGEKANNWITSNLKKAAEGAWDVGVSVATKVLTEAALKYYGLK